MRRRALGLCVALLLLAGCAQRPTVKDSAPRIAATQERLTALVEQIEGTRRDRLAGELISYHIYQDGLVSCMANEGFTYQPPPFVDPTLALRDPIILHSEWLDPLSDDFGLIWLARAHTIVDGNLLAAERTRTPYESLSPKEQAAYDLALDTVCDNGSSNGYEDANFPKGFFETEGTLFTVLDDVSKELDGYRGDYVECMKAAGIDMTNRPDMFNELVYGMPDYPDASDGTAIDTWTGWVDKVKASASADATCRKTAYEVGMTLLAPRLDNFEEERAAEIAGVVAAWEDMVAVASDYPEFATSLEIPRPDWPNWNGEPPV